MKIIFLGNIKPRSHVITNVFHFPEFGGYIGLFLGYSVADLNFAMSLLYDQLSKICAC